MASYKQEGTAADAEQLRSMSLGKSVENKDDKAEPTAAKNGTPTKLCSACGKKSDALKKCNGCKCVWYCDKECQNKHRKMHKKECRPIKKILDQRGGKLDLGNEKDVGPLGKLPPREECPICMRVLPLHSKFHAYFGCCGKTLCCGCAFQHQIKSEEQGTCAFCRTTVLESDDDEGVLTLLSTRVKLNDPSAMFSLAMNYRHGRHGLPVDEAKCIDLLRQSADLGYPDAQFHLGNIYSSGIMGLEQNEEEAAKYWEKAVEGGHVTARHNLGCEEGNNGNAVAGMRHFRMSASGGFKKSRENLIQCFAEGALHHCDLAETMQSFYCARDELKSKDRDEYIAYLKTTGEYHEEYDV